MVIGIDPDTDKNGVAVFDAQAGTIELLSLRFFELYDYLNERIENIESVKIEGGWLNAKSNFRAAKSQSIGERMAKNVGANHEAGRKIVEMCEYLCLSHNIVKPLKKIWKTDSGKISHDELLRVLKPMGISLLHKKTSNQEQRDAALIAII